MLFALICDDRPGAGNLRAETRPAHVQHLHGLGSALKLAGPFLSEDGVPNGSLLVVEADSAEGARAIAERDPFSKAGLFASVTVRPWNWTIHNPEAA